MTARDTVFRAGWHGEVVCVICPTYGHAAFRLDRHASDEFIEGIRS